MKIAYLISVYKDELQLRRTIEALFQGEYTYFFVHVDKKVDQVLFEQALFPQYKEYVKFTSQRYWVQWGGFNQVRYQKCLLEECINSGMSFDRVFIITGQDYPLVSNEEINRELETNSLKEYIIGMNMSKEEIPLHAKQNITLYHYFRDLEGVSYKVKKIFSGISRLIMRLLPFRKKDYLVINGERWDVYKASSYMCITFNLAKYLVEQLNTNKILMKYFRYSFVPEEMVIPTIVFNSKFKNQCQLLKGNNCCNLLALSSITYFDYGDSIKTFTEKDIEELRACGRMFARKFTSGLSDELIKILKNRKIAYK